MDFHLQVEMKVVLFKKKIFVLQYILLYLWYKTSRSKGNRFIIMENGIFNFNNIDLWVDSLLLFEEMKYKSSIETCNKEAFDLVKKFRKDLYCNDNFLYVVKNQYDLFSKLSKMGIASGFDYYFSLEHMLSESLSGDAFCNIELILLSNDKKYIKDFLFNEKCTYDVLNNLYLMVKEEYHYVINRNLSITNLITNGVIKSDVSSILDDLLFAQNSPNRKYTYVMSDCSGLYKIGKSINPVDRKKMLAIGNPTLKLEFYIEGDRELELHRYFKHKRESGEWFRLNKNDLKIIRNYNNIRSK